MKILKTADIKSSPTTYGVDARKVYDTENAVAVDTIKPGESLKKHSTC